MLLHPFIRTCPANVECQFWQQQGQPEDCPATLRPQLSNAQNPLHLHHGRTGLKISVSEFSIFNIQFMHYWYTVIHLVIIYIRFYCNFSGVSDLWHKPVIRPWCIRLQLSGDRLVQNYAIYLQLNLYIKLR